MKSLMYLLLLTIASLSASVSQAQTDSVKIPNSVFPIWGMEFGGPSDNRPHYSDSNIARAKRAYLNGIYGGPGFMGAAPELNGGLKGSVELMGCLDLNTRLGHASSGRGLQLLATYSGSSKHDADELHWFLSANEGKLVQQDGRYVPESDDATPDLMYSWDTVAGAPAASGQPNAGVEWLIRDTVFATSDYVLKHLMIDRHDGNASPSGYGGDFWREKDSMHCAFIYRLGTDASRFDSATLFEVEYYGVYEDTTTNPHTQSWVLLDHAPLRYNSYASFIGSSHPNENPRVLRFPDKSGIYTNAAWSQTEQASISSQSYAVSYNTIPENVHVSGKVFKYIDCWVKKLQLVDLYVRGLRIRTPLAEQQQGGCEQSLLLGSLKPQRDIVK